MKPLDTQGLSPAQSALCLRSVDRFWSCRWVGRNLEAGFRYLRDSTAPLAMTGRWGREGNKGQGYITRS